MSKRKKSTLSIGDMACSGCSETVRQVLKKIKGVKEASADHEKGRASVTYNTNTVSATDFKQAIEDAGYTFKGMNN